ncbi:TKL/LISK/LISK-DD1 protein kinase [Puccinia sorghi]|uniref:TKL/LISK/LISK-DD1 protein kinase n=1 Tax=Puccinia sorghi TaxID=27349 RepID=A0A0L6V276_9BASI|nr:TKL/LISK/LISK-DD1 protein kinase [Puccinia sorghi]
MSASPRFDVIKFEDLSIESTWAKLGEGSFGCVYRAQYLGLPIAIKEIIPRTDYDVEKYFARECKISKDARHPNIVQYIGLCLAPPSMETIPVGLSQKQNQDNFFSGDKKSRASNAKEARVLIISEYVSKGNLRNYLTSRLNSPNPQPVSWRLRVSFAIDIARAVAYLHERKCLHRDLKLDNCLLTENFRVKLCDFGMARFEARTPEEVRQLSFCGTDGYMSPEVLRGLPFDLSTDVYSLGIIFCELISMKRAGTCTSDSTSNESVFLQRAPPRYSIKSADVNSLLDAQNDGCPKSFIELSLRCTQVDSRLRPTPKEILVVLDSIEQAIIQEEHVKLLGVDDAPGSRQGTIPSVGSMKFVKSNIKLMSTDTFKRIPSFHGQIVIPKAAAASSPASNPDLELKMESLQDDESFDSESVIDLGIDSFPLDPRLLHLINMKKITPISTDFFTSTLKLPGPVSPRKGFPSAFLSQSEPLENIATVEETSASSSSTPSECAFVAKSEALCVPDLIPSQLGTIPTYLSENNTVSSTSDSFKEAMQELEKAYRLGQGIPGDIDNSSLFNNFQASTSTVVPATLKSHSEPQPFNESDVAEKSPILIPHRFTIVKSHWLANLLNLNHKDPSAKEPKNEKSCAACRKPIGSRKTFLRCDDCGETCHQKCSDSAELSQCKRHSLP